MNWLKKVYADNKAIVWAGIIAIVLSLAVLFKIKDDVTRFTLIMPVFAGFILFSILITPDEELEDVKTDIGGKEEKKKSPKLSKKK
jgi:hypothetical protein